MSLLELFDPKVIVIAATYKLWLPLARILWQAANPYPAWFQPPALRRSAEEGPQLEDRLESEEWAVWRVRRERERDGEELAPVEAGPTTPRVRRLSGAEAASRRGLRRSA